MENELANAEAFLATDELRHITPLKMVGLYRAQTRAVRVSVSALDSDESAFLLLMPRAVSQYDSANYPEAVWTVIPAVAAGASAALIAACAAAIVEQMAGAPFVLKTVEPPLVDALRPLLAAKVDFRYARALCTFSVDRGSEVCGSTGSPRTEDALPDSDERETRLQVTDHIPGHARALLSTHAVYSANELATMFADGSARCFLRVVANEPLAVLLSFPNTRTLFEVGSLYVTPAARRLGLGQALVRAALDDLALRGLTVRYVVDAENAPSIALATRCGLREIMRLEHWLASAR